MSHQYNKILVDKTNIKELKQHIIEEVKSCSLIGADLETQDVKAHEGIKRLRKESEEGDKLADAKLVFDWRRMVITGLSIYPDNSDSAYYFNLNHADVGNRLDWQDVKDILDSKAETACFICHNAPFELTVLANVYGYELKDVVCTMQMAVSAYGPDEYPVEQYSSYGLGEIPQLFPEVRRLFGNTQKSADDVEEEAQSNSRLNFRQQELLNKVIGKETKSSYSYNGLIYEMSYSYGLKKMIEKFFMHRMTTFEEALQGKRHMGELTAAQVCEYGCEDSYWAVQLFYKLYAFMQQHSPNAINTFFTQENPMINVFSKVRQEGMLVNKPAIEGRQSLERSTFAQKLREMKALMKELLPFPFELDERLYKYEKWYGPTINKAGAHVPAKASYYRARLSEYINSPDSDDDFKQACQVSSPVSNSWAGKKLEALSINHYFQTRLMMYDLCRVPAIIYKGKVMSDGECRGEVRDKIKALIQDNCDDPTIVKFYQNADKLIQLMGELSSVEQRMKLYITPYLCLTDPETGRMYPELSSMLATRRLAAINPNPMQLSKRTKESLYIRGFYLPDYDDEAIVSIDWSQIELVLIGDASRDPAFAKAYGQLPYQDLHIGTTADVLSVVIPEVTEDMIKNMHKMRPDELPEKLLIKPNGELLTPQEAKKFWRTEVGKGSNFNYWFSGALSTVGEKLGWTSNQMWAATERYRERFPVGEAFRVSTIEEARHCGFVELPDGHRRYKYEATYEWQNITRRLFGQYQDDAITKFGNEVIRSLKTRAGNQIFNALIQGSCATLAKRSIPAIITKMQEAGIVGRFKMCIHDELLFSIRRDQVAQFIKIAKAIMCDHPEIIKTLKIDATAAVGLTFEPFNEKTAPFGQVELDEAPAFLGFGDGVKLNDEQIQLTVDKLFERRRNV